MSIDIDIISARQNSGLEPAHIGNSSFPTTPEQLKILLSTGCWLVRIRVKNLQGTTT